MDAWAAWLISGFVLLALELFFPTGFFLFIFGIGALCTGGLTYLGLLSAPALQWGSWSVISILCSLFLRKPLMGIWSPSTSENAEALAGEEVEIQTDIPPGGTSKGELRGSNWNVKNIGSQTAVAGKRYRIEKVDSLTLHIKP